MRARCYIRVGGWASIDEAGVALLPGRAAAIVHLVAGLIGRVRDAGFLLLLVVPSVLKGGLLELWGAAEEGRDHKKDRPFDKVLDAVQDKG